MSNETLLLLHAVLGASASAPQGEGWELIEEPSSGLFIAARRVPSRVLEAPDREALLRYAQHVEVLFEVQDVAPLRFGSSAPDVEGAREMVRQRASALQRCLKRVAGCAEIGLRIQLPEPSPPALAPDDELEASASARGSPGLRFLRERQAYWSAQRAREDHARQSAEPFLEALADLAREVAPIEPPARPGHGLSVSMLVGRQDVAGAREVLDEQLAPEQLARVAFHGPFPPYSFCALE